MNMYVQVAHHPSHDHPWPVLLAWNCIHVQGPVRRDGRWSESETCMSIAWPCLHHPPPLSSPPWVTAGRLEWQDCSLITHSPVGSHSVDPPALLEPHAEWCSDFSAESSAMGRFALCQIRGPSSPRPRKPALHGNIHRALQLAVKARFSLGAAAGSK